MDDDSPGAASGDGLSGFQGLPGRTDQASLDHHVLTSTAERLDALADMAELMGDEDGARSASEDRGDQPPSRGVRSCSTSSDATARSGTRADHEGELPVVRRRTRRPR